MFTLTNALNVVREIGLYAIEFVAPDGEAVVYLDGRRVLGVTGSNRPDITRLLTRRGLEPLDVTLATHQEERCPLNALLEKRLLSCTQASEVLSNCVAQTLLPLGWQATTFSAQDVTPEELPVPWHDLDVDVETLLCDVSWWSMMVPRAFRELRPGDRVRALPPRTIPAEAIKHGEVYLALLHGMTLGEAAQCLALRWDELLQAVMDLTAHDLLACPVAH